MTDTIQTAVENPPVDPATLFADLPEDWAGWLAFRGAVIGSGRARQAVRHYMADHLDEGSQGLAVGLGLCACGEWTRALPLLEAADSDLARLLAGRLRADAGQRKAALELWSRLVDGPLSTQARTWRAGALFDLRDEDGLSAETEALAGAGEAAAAFAAGLLAFVRGEHAAAGEQLERALSADPRHAEAAFQLARLLDLCGDDDGALAVLERFRSGALPHHAGAMVNLGLLLEDREDHRAAAACYRAVVDADPTNERARRYLGDAEASQEQYYDESRERKADKQNAVLRIPVTDFELSVRARNCLQRMNIHTLGDLVCRTESELLSFKNFGETSLQEVKDILQVKGLRLGMMPPDQRGDSGAGLLAMAPEGDPLKIKISDLDLSVRSRAALATLGITNVGELTQTTETTLLSCKNFGQTSLDEIKSKLRALNLGLAG